MRRRGFTLLELMIVMAMISIIAAIVLPRLDPFLPQRRLKSAARVLSGTISLAYGEAIAKNTTYRLYIDSRNNKYWITEARELEDEEGATAIGLRLGTHMELLQYTESSRNVEEETPSEPMFAPRDLPAGVHFSSIEVQRDMSTAAIGPEYIEFTPLGVASPATINLATEDGDAIAIRYDGITGLPVLIPLSGETG